MNKYAAHVHVVCQACMFRLSDLVFLITMVITKSMNMLGNWHVSYVSCRMQKYNVPGSC